MSRHCLKAGTGLLVVAFAFLVHPGTTLSQGNVPRGFYRGQVLERGDKPVASALVLFTDKNSGVAYSAFSDDQGKYEIHVPRGTYTLLLMIEDKTYEPEEAGRQAAAGAWTLTFAPTAKGSISEQEVSLTSDRQEIVVQPKEKARGARKTVLLEVVSPPPPNVTIQAIRVEPETPVRPGQAVRVTVEGTRNGTATVSLGSAVTGRPLEEDRSAPGTYRGTVEVPNDYEGAVLVSATLVSEDAGETTFNGPQIRVTQVPPGPATPSPTPVVEQPEEQPPAVREAAPAESVPAAEAAPPAAMPEPAPSPAPAPAVVPGVPPPAPRAAQPAAEAIDPAAITAALGVAHFEFDSDDLREDAGALLTQAAMLLEQKGVLGRPDLWLVIEGHCDEVGSDEYNDRLGLRRAEAARNLLVSEGLPSGRTKTVSYGRHCPVVRLGTAADQNRRVKLRVLSLSGAEADRPIDASACPRD